MEVKGNYHQQVVESLRTQLADGSLAGPSGNEGIYVVGYFHGTNWDPADSRRLRQAAKHPVDSLRDLLNAEASAAAADGKTVHVRVLDIPWTGKVEPNCIDENELVSDRTVALLLPTLSWSWREEEVLAPQPPEARRSAAIESMRWQELSAVAASAELTAYPLPIRRVERWNGVERVIEPGKGAVPREQNRILEIHGLMGAIGEQLAMAWTAEQDAQRLVFTAEHRDELSTRLMLRAESELVGHFLFGATHSLANLVLRALLLNSAAAQSLEKDYKVAGFPPGSDDRTVWPTFGPTMAQRLRRAAHTSQNPGMVRLAEVISSLRIDPAYAALDGRRGMDYHRRRPQSVAHTAPRGGTVSTANGQTTLSMVAPRLEPEASAEGVHSVVVAALEAVAQSMREVRRATPEAIRGEGINYVYDFNPSQ